MYWVQQDITKLHSREYTFFLSQATQIVLSQQLLYIIEFVLVLNIAEILLAGR